MNNKDITAIIFFVIIVQLYPVTGRACTDDPAAPVISVSGAAASTTESNYYGVKIPDTGDPSVTVTITATGDTPCPDPESEYCSCIYTGASQSPDPDGGVAYTFDYSVGTQSDSGDGNTITWQVDSSTNPAEYTFQVSDLFQYYQACPNGWDGGVAYKENDQQSDIATVLAYKLDHQTVYTEPSNTARTTVGVYEQVGISVEPSSVSATWDDTVDGSGGSNIAGDGLGGYTYTAGGSNGLDTLTARFNGLSDVLSFTVIEPASVTEVENARVADGTNTTPLSLEYTTFVYLGPDSVNFSNAQVYEGVCTASGDGYFSYLNGDVLTPGESVTGSGVVVSGKGTAMGGDAVGVATTGSPYGSGGALTLSIPWYYVPGSSEPTGGTQFTTTTETGSLTVTGATATLQVSKAGASDSISSP